MLLGPGTVGEETGVTKPSQEIGGEQDMEERDMERTWQNVMGDGIWVLFLFSRKRDVS